MKYCLSGRQPLSALKQADEIKMKYEDRERAIDYIQAFPEKTIIIEVPKDIEEIEWKLLDAYNENCSYVIQYIVWATPIGHRCSVDFFRL